MVFFEKAKVREDEESGVRSSESVSYGIRPPLFLWVTI